MLVRQNTYTSDSITQTFTFVSHCSLKFTQYNIIQRSITQICTCTCTLPTKLIARPPERTKPMLRKVYYVLHSLAYFVFCLQILAQYYTNYYYYFPHNVTNAALQSNSMCKLYYTAQRASTTCICNLLLLYFEYVLILYIVLHFMLATDAPVICAFMVDFSVTVAR